MSNLIDLILFLLAVQWITDYYFYRNQDILGNKSMFEFDESTDN